MNEQTHTTEETVSSQETNEEISTNFNAEQATSEENGTSSRTTESGQVDFAQMYDMLTERDATIKTLKSEIAELKKSNTNLLLKVNASASADAQLKTPYQSFIDSMVTR